MSRTREHVHCVDDGPSLLSLTLSLILHFVCNFEHISMRIALIKCDYYCWKNVSFSFCYCLFFLLHFCFRLQKMPTKNYNLGMYSSAFFSLQMEKPTPDRHINNTDFVYFNHFTTRYAINIFIHMAVCLPLPTAKPNAYIN